MKGYSLVEGLLRGLLNRREHHPSHSASSLTPEERLFVVRTVDPGRDPAGLAQLHLDCHCFAEAYEGFARLRHHRKLGDAAWAMGDLDLAARHYLDTSRGAQSYRQYPDYDRLIRLAFLRGDAAAFFEWFKAGGFAPDASEKDRVWVGGSKGSSRPYLEMLAVQWRVASEAGDGFFRDCLDFGEEEEWVWRQEGDYEVGELRKKEVDPEEAFLEHLEECFGISPDEWRAFASAPRFGDPAIRTEIMARCLPIPCRHPPVSLAAAMETGATGRARVFVDTIRDIDRLVDEAQDALERFRDGGSEEDLSAWADRIGRLGDDPLTSNLVFASLGHGSYEAPPDLMDRLRQRETEFQYKSLPIREGGGGEVTTP